MTRETKIGLLVGLAFIIVIGILLSDHLTSSTEPPPATLANAGSSVMQTVNTPGAGTAAQAQPLTPPAQVQPNATVPTQGDLATRQQQPQQQPVQIVQIGPGSTGAQPQPQQSQPRPITIRADQQQPQPQPQPQPQQSNPVITMAEPNRPQQPTASAQPAEEDSPLITQVPGSNDQNNSLVRVAQQHGEQLVGIDESGRPTSATPTWADVLHGGAQEHVAQSGDSVSKWANRFLGANTKTNRDAIIALNPSLQANPNKVIVGQKYLIPSGAAASSSTVAQQLQPQPQPQPQETQQILQTSGGEAIASATDYFYTVRENDSLWKIANEQLGNPGAVAAIKELNQLKSDTITPGMKLRLPGKPIAQATN